MVIEQLDAHVQPNAFYGIQIWWIWGKTSAASRAGSGILLVPGGIVDDLNVSIPFQADRFAGFIIQYELPDRFWAMAFRCECCCSVCPLLWGRA